MSQKTGNQQDQKSVETAINNVSANLAIKPSTTTGKLFGTLKPAPKSAKVTDFYRFTVSIQAEMTLACDENGQVVEIKDLKYVKSFNPSRPSRIE